MSAFAMFSLKAPSLLAFDQQRAAGHWGTIYGIERVPCDTSMRARLDPVSPASRRSSFKGVFRQLQRGKALEAMACLDGHDLVSLDGTGDVASKTIHCASCVQQVHRNGSITSDHHMLGAAIVHPETRAVLPLMPEPMVKQDGTDKNDGARNAAKRCMAKLRQDHPHLKCIITDDRLSAHAPPIETLHAHGRHDIRGVNEGDHADLCKPAQAAEPAGRVTSDERHDRAAGRRHRVRFVHDMPLNESKAEVRGNFLEYWEIGTAQVHHCSGVTDWRVRKRHVNRRMRGGRARWKIAHETFHTLKNQGDHFEHHDGHGPQHLSGVFATMMMVAFLVDPTQQLCCALLQAVWAKLGRKRLLGERMRALVYDDALESMRQRREALFDGVQKPTPSFASASSGSRQRFPLRPRAIASDDPSSWGASLPPPRDESACHETSWRA